jgi:hypothetical protein
VPPVRLRTRVRAVTWPSNSGSYRFRFHLRMGFTVEPAPARSRDGPTHPDYDQDGSSAGGGEVSGGPVHRDRERQEGRNRNEPGRGPAEDGIEDAGIAQQRLDATVGLTGVGLCGSAHPAAGR